MRTATCRAASSAGRRSPRPRPARRTSTWASSACRPARARGRTTTRTARAPSSCSRAGSRSAGATTSRTRSRSAPATWSTCRRARPTSCATSPMPRRPSTSSRATRRRRTRSRCPGPSGSTRGRRDRPSARRAAGPRPSRRARADARRPARGGDDGRGAQPRADGGAPRGGARGLGPPRVRLLDVVRPRDGRAGRPRRAWAGGVRRPAGGRGGLARRARALARGARHGDRRGRGRGRVRVARARRRRGVHDDDEPRLATGDGEARLHLREDGPVQDLRRPRALPTAARHAGAGGLTVAELAVRSVPLEQTRALRQAVLRPHQSVDELAADEPAGSLAFGAFDGDALVAVGLVGRDGGRHAWRVRGMATEPGARGRGAGTAVLDALVRHADAEGAELVWCNARTGAVSLYERAGFEVVSDVFEPPHIGPHVRMERRAFRGFPADAFAWFAGLEADNSKAYFTATRERYEREVKGALAELLEELSGEFGGAARVFRQQRDLRFTPDKTPYKTRTYGVLVDVPDTAAGFYAELSASGLYAGTGYYGMARDQLERYRAAVADEAAGAELERIVAGTRDAGLDLAGQTLRTAPRGMRRDPPRIELLRHSSLFAGRRVAGDDGI